MCIYEYFNKLNHSYNETNRDALRDQHDAMPFYEKATENTLLAVSTVALVVLALFAFLAVVGGLRLSLVG
jgi:hypothetical protein